MDGFRLPLCPFSRAESTLQDPRKENHHRTEIRNELPVVVIVVQLSSGAPKQLERLRAASRCAIAHIPRHDLVMQELGASLIVIDNQRTAVGEVMIRANPQASSRLLCEPKGEAENRAFPGSAAY